MKANADARLIPAPFADRNRARVTAGFAKLVDTVEKYAEPIQAGTKYGIALPRPCAILNKIIKIRIVVAINSPR